MIRLLAKAIRSISAWFWTSIARLQLMAHGVSVPKNLVVKGCFGLCASGTIWLGKNLTIVNGTRFNRAGINHSSQIVALNGAKLKIGANVGLSGVVIYCAESITIGNYVLLGANSKIYDTDFHPMDHLIRRDPSCQGNTKPVVIEDDVWLCADVKVLKGVRIGARSVIAAGSVVTKDIPPDSIAAGIPAKPL